MAVGTIQPQARREPLLWGLLAGLHELDVSPVLFRSTCQLGASDPQRAITGRPARHLDSWAMSQRAAVHSLDRATGPRELAVVDGNFDPAARVSPGKVAAEPAPPTSRLEKLCDWLDLPRIAIVDVAQLASCVLPPRPQRLDGLLLDRVADARAAAYWQTTLEAL